MYAALDARGACFRRLVIIWSAKPPAPSKHVPLWSKRLLPAVQGKAGSVGWGGERDVKR